MSNRRRTRSQAQDRARRSQALRGAGYDEPMWRLNSRLTTLLVAVDRVEADWRTAARDEELAFVRWRAAVGKQRRLAAAAFVAALEREEMAALEYRVAWEASCAAVH